VSVLEEKKNPGPPLGFPILHEVRMLDSSEQYFTDSITVEVGSINLFF